LKPGEFLLALCGQRIWSAGGHGGDDDVVKGITSWCKIIKRQCN